MLLYLLLFQLEEISSKVFFYMPRRSSKLVDLLSSPCEDYQHSIKEFSRWSSLCVSYLPQVGFFISLYPRGGTITLMCSVGLYSLLLHEVWSSLIILEAGSLATLITFWDPLLSRYYPSRCVTFVAKRDSFFAKCVAFLAQCFTRLISLLWFYLLLPFDYSRWSPPNTPCWSAILI